MIRRRGRPLRWTRRALSLLLGAYVLSSAAGSYVATVGARGRPSVPPQQIESTYQNVTFASRQDAVRLSGWLFRSPNASGRSVILVHGWHGEREDVDFAPLAKALLGRGYDVLMFDLRGSGASGSSTQTFANHEPRDILGAYDFMVARGYAPRLMAVLGNSMGAASVIEAAPQLTGVAALICDSAYTTVGGAAENGLSEMTGLPGFLVLPALEFARVWGVNPDLRPIDVVHSLRRRAFLFIQSRHDNLVDPASAAQLRAASMDPQSELLIIDGTRHLDTFSRNPSLYLATLTSFIDSQIRSRA